MSLVKAQETYKLAAKEIWGENMFILSPPLLWMAAPDAPGPRWMRSEGAEN